MNAQRTIVIGVVGRNGSGKDSLIKYLARAHNIPALSIGDVVRQIAEQQGLPTTRENLHEISQKLMKQAGPDVFTRQVVRQIEQHDWRAVAVGGIRTPDDVKLFRARFGEDFVLVHVAVDDAHLRFDRLKLRDEPRDPSSFEEFQQQERMEEEQFRLSETIRRADLTVQNDGSLEDFHQQIEEQLLQRYLPTERT